MPSAPSASDGMQAALAFLGVGPMHAYNAQADTLEGELDDYLGRRCAYAAAERSETGKSNDLCSSVQGSSSEVLIAQELRLKV